MLKQYRAEVLTAVTIGFMAFYPPWAGLGLFLFALSFGAFDSYLRFESSPDVKQFKKDIELLKANVEKLTLRGNR